MNNRTRHGLPILDGPIREFGELNDLARVESKVQRRIPAAIIARGYNSAKGHHYPSAVLFRLQKGACFFCGEDIHPLPHPYSRHGYAKAYFYSKLDHYPLWGNKVLGHKVCCVRHHRGEGPTQDQIAKFNHLYSHAVFLAEFGAEEAATIKGEAA